MPDIGDRDRIGNPEIDPATGVALAAPPPPFTTGGVATDPTTVLLTIRKPDDTRLEFGWPDPEVDGLLVRESTGRFYQDVTYDLSGTWKYRLEGTGACVAAEEGFVQVNHSWLET